MSLVVFSLVGALSTLLTAVHDRNFPGSLGITASAQMSFYGSQGGFTDAASEIAEFADASDGIRVYRVLPDRAGTTGTERLIVPLSHSRTIPAEVGTFGDQPMHSAPLQDAMDAYPEGLYLVAASEADLDTFDTWLSTHGVDVTWTRDSEGSLFDAIMSLPTALNVELAAVALLASLSLYWLGVRTRGRAVRRLAGTSRARIDLEDLWLVLSVVALGGLGVGSVAAVALVFTDNAAHIPFFQRTYGIMSGTIIAVAAILLVVTLLLNPARVNLIVSRRPMSPGLRRSAHVMKTLMIGATLFAVAPTLTAIDASSTAAADVRRWDDLADRVGLSMLAGADEDPNTATALSQMLSDQNKHLRPALSYTLTLDYPLGLFDTVALVDDTWLELTAGRHRLEPVRADDLPDGLRDELLGSLTVLTPNRQTPDLCEECEFRLLTTTEPLTLLPGGRAGAIATYSRPLLVVMPTPLSLNTGALEAMASSGNVTFQGLGATRAALARYDLNSAFQAQLVAQEQQVRARYARYFAINQALAAVGVLIAAAMSIGISCYISAASDARRAYLLRLAGLSGGATSRARILWDFAVVGLVTVVAVVQTTQSRDTLAVVLASGLVIALVIAGHRIASTVTFRQTRDRQL